MSNTIIYVVIPLLTLVIWLIYGRIKAAKTITDQADRIQVLETGVRRLNDKIDQMEADARRTRELEKLMFPPRPRMDPPLPKRTMSAGNRQSDQRTVHEPYPVLYDIMPSAPAARQEESTRPDPIPEAGYQGRGGSFDGGGASGDYAYARSSDSCSSASSSSSDSGSSSSSSSSSDSSSSCSSD